MTTAPFWRPSRETGAIHLTLSLTVVLLSVLVQVIAFDFFADYPVAVATVPFVVVIPIVTIPVALGVVPGILVTVILLTTTNALQIRYQLDPQVTVGLQYTLWFLAILLSIGAGVTAHAIRRLNRAVAAHHLAQREAHHRIKNNLNLAASLLSLQADQLLSPDGQEILQKTRNHLRSIAAVHDALTHATNADEVDIHSHIHSLAAAIHPHPSEPSGGPPLVTVSGPTHRLPGRLAVSFGIILNELVTNAIKHGGHETAHTHVAVRAPDGSGGLSVEIKQPGINLPNTFSLDSNTAGTGLLIIGQVVEQHQGRLRVTSRTPAVFELVLTRSR